MLTLQYAKNPVYANADGTSIDLIVKWEEFNEEMPFSATTWNPEQYGRDLYFRAYAGEFGQPAPYVAQTVAEDQPSTTGSQNL